MGKIKRCKVHGELYNGYYPYCVKDIGAIASFLALTFAPCMLALLIIWLLSL